MRKLLEGQIALVVGSAPVAARIKTALAMEGAHVVGDDPEQTASLIEDVDIVVDVGGVFPSRPLVRIDPHQWRSAFDGNVLHGVCAIGQVLPGMIMRDHGAVILLVVDTASETPWNYVPLEVASGARLALANALAKTIVNSKVVITTFVADAAEFTSAPGELCRSIEDGTTFSVSEFIGFVVDVANTPSTSRRSDRD